MNAVKMCVQANFICLTCGQTENLCTRGAEVR